MNSESDTERHALDTPALDQLFLRARTARAWTERQVDGATIRRMYDLLKTGPTSANCQPARFVFVRSPESKARLKPALSPGNIEKTMTAPLTVIVGYDLEFYRYLPRTFPGRNVAHTFANDRALAESTAFRNGSLQGAYLIMAARALGLDCGPMSGFDNAAVDRDFFAGTAIRSNFLCNLGYRAPTTLAPRDPRLEFAEVCRFE